MEPRPTTSPLRSALRRRAEVKQVAELVGPVRIALSGTPVENRLADLHSQFERLSAWENGPWEVPVVGRPSGGGRGGGRIMEHPVGEVGSYT